MHCVTKGSSAESMRGSAPPAWLWMFAISAIVVFCSFIAYLDSHRLDKPGVTGAKPKESKVITTNKPSRSTPETKGTQFDFYKLLPGLEVLIPEESSVSTTQPTEGVEGKDSPRLDIEPARLSDPQTAPVSPAQIDSEQVQYFLQVGSFKDIKAADRRKAEVGLLGLESKIYRVSLPNSGVWHRVRLGPFASLKEMRQVKNRLKNNKLQVIMLKVKS